MNKKDYILYLFLLFFVSISACTTTERTVSTSISVQSPTEQLNKAKKAFAQKNYSLAAKLLRPLVIQGQDYAQYALGYMYYNGMGVPRDKRRAIQLLNAAAANGNENAIEAIRLLSASMNENAGASRTPVSDIPASTNETSENLSEGFKSVESSEELVPEHSAPDHNISELDSAAAQLEPQAEILEIEQQIPPVIENQKAEPLVEEQEIAVKNPVETTEVLSSLTDGEKWILSQPDTNYTIQLLVSGNESAMQQYIVENNLQDQAIFYRSPNNGNELFILIQGSFKSFNQASKTISSLPDNIQASKPWVRNISVIRKTILSRYRN